ncbi:MAG: membrane dipeptidase [Candidatus Kerfeldbacteria bacterium]|nr:membrane dipeptidase [Candidatus Kerfeldbacteria bacterium]
MGFSQTVSQYVRDLVSAHAFDAHLDYPGQGGWGSAEQLVNADKLKGALRVFFCEEDGHAPSNVDEHLREIARLDPLLAGNAPGRKDPRHIEGCESVRSEDEICRVLDEALKRGIVSVGPIYHRDNPLGGCSKESGIGLTHLGVRFLSTATFHNLRIDLAHMSAASMDHVLRVVWLPPAPNKSPISYTHGGVWHDGVTHPLIVKGNRERCLLMECAKQIIDMGGFVGLSPCAPFYDEPSVFFDHLLELHSFVPRVGIGTDYGGILDEWCWPGCETVFDLFCYVTHELFKRGLTEQQVAGIIGDNFRHHLGLL